VAERRIQTEDVRPRLFWPLLALGSLCLALAGGSFATALFSEPVASLPRRISDYDIRPGVQIGVYWETDIFGRVTSLDWSSDRGFLIAAILLGVVGFAALGAAARAR
jgi:hypothetical protein